MDRAHSESEHRGSVPDPEDLGRDLTEIAGALQARAGCEAQRHQAYVPVSISAPCVHTILFVRRLRKGFGFQTPDAAWEMMLTILAARLDRRRLSVAELSEGCGMSPRATARWVRKLEKEGFLLRHDPLGPGQPASIDLTEQAAARLCNYLDAALQISPWVL